MTQQEKELLLKDLSARLSYGVKLKTPKGDGHLNEITLSIFGTNVGVNIQATIREYLPLEDCKPYLRPMSSMTKEERETFSLFGGVMSYNPQKNTWGIAAFSPEAYDWLNEHHFDYHGLIEKGLAIESSKEIYD